MTWKKQELEYVGSFECLRIHFSASFSASEPNTSRYAQEQKLWDAINQTTALERIEWGILQLEHNLATLDCEVDGNENIQKGLNKVWRS